MNVGWIVNCDCANNVSLTFLLLFLSIVMVASTLLSVYKDSVRYPKLTQAVVQGCIVAYVFLSLLQWQSEKEVTAG